MYKCYNLYICTLQDTLFGIYVYRASLCIVTPHIHYYVEYGKAVHGFRVHSMSAAIGAIDTSRVWYQLIVHSHTTDHAQHCIQLQSHQKPLGALHPHIPCSCYVGLSLEYALIESQAHLSSTGFSWLACHATIPYILPATAAATPCTYSTFSASSASLASTQIHSHTVTLTQ